MNQQLDLPFLVYPDDVTGQESDFEREDLDTLAASLHDPDDYNPDDIEQQFIFFGRSLNEEGRFY